MKNKKNSNVIRVVLFGAGRMGLNHVRVLQNMPQYKLVAIIDNKLPSRKFDVPVYENLKSLAGLEYHAAIVATPTHTHYKVVTELLKSGKNVLVEKPLASNVSDAKKLVKLAKEKRLKLAVGHVERFNPAVQKLREVIEFGHLGTPIHYSFTRVGGYPNDPGPGNNVLVDLAVHDLDVLNFLHGKMKVKACACHATVKKNVLDTAEILLCTPRKGASASIHVNWITPAKIRTLRVTGTKAVGVIDYMLQTCTVYGGDLVGKRRVPEINFQQLVQAYQGNDKIEFGVSKEEPLKLELEQFAGFVKGDKNLTCTGEQALYALEMAEEALNG